MKVIVDRFEGEYAVLEGGKARLSRSLIPEAEEGDVINISVDKAATKQRLAAVKELMDDLFSD